MIVHNTIQRCGKDEHVVYKEQKEQNAEIMDNCYKFHQLQEKEEGAKYNFIENCNNTKLLWGSQGRYLHWWTSKPFYWEIKNHYETGTVRRPKNWCKNDQLDKKITPGEIKDSAEQIKTNLKTSDGISALSL